MYDPLKHYISEGLMVVYSYPRWDDSDGLSALILKIACLTVDIIKEDDESVLRVKKGDVWFTYDIDEHFYTEYSINVGSLVEADKRATAWTDNIAAITSGVNIKELA